MAIYPEKKYRLREFFDELTADTRGAAVQELATKWGTTANYVRKVWNYPVSSRRSSTVDQLILASEFFSEKLDRKITLEDMITQCVSSTV